MDFDEIFEKITNRELTICETCDNIFNYSRNRVFCDECQHKRRLARQRKSSKRRRIEIIHKRVVKKRLTDIEILMDKILKKKLTICETCDNIFDYVPQKIYCDDDECVRARQRKYREENHERILAYKREYNKANRELPDA